MSLMLQQIKILNLTLDKHLMYDDFAMIKRFDFVNMNNKDESKNR